jgi:hypothetical protein
MKAIHEEINSLKKDDTYEVVKLPEDMKAGNNKWMFKLRKDGNKMLKYNGRLVIKGFRRKQGIDGSE